MRRSNIKLSKHLEDMLKHKSLSCRKIHGSFTNAKHPDSRTQAHT